MSSGSGKSAKGEVVQYYMSLHYGLCAGSVDKITELWYGEKLMWSGEVTSNTNATISKGNLFGGIKKEGGPEGTVHFLFGKNDQVVPSELSSALGVNDPNDCPAFRGVTSIFFDDKVIKGSDAIGQRIPIGGGKFKQGFVWTANNPYLKEVWAKVTRKPLGLDPSKAMIITDDVEDANPANIVYECLTNGDWGIGVATSDIDIPAFNALQQAMVDENFGMSIAWTGESSVEDFVNTVLDHIKGVIYTDPSTGKITVKLIRGDYDPSTLRVITPDGATISSFSRKSFGDSVNEVKVTWRNPVNEQDETVIVQDTANIATLGQVITETKDYPGIRNSDLAMRVAARELRWGSAPVCSIDMSVNRTAWDLSPGDVIKVTWPDYGLNEIVMRVMKIDYGRIGQSEIKLTLIEDIFGLSPAAYTQPSGSMWQDPSQDPIPLTHEEVFTAPAYFIENALGVDIAEVDYPNVMGVTVGASVLDDAYGFTLREEVPAVGGGTEWVISGEMELSGYGALQAPLVEEASSAVTSFGAVMSNYAAEGKFVIIGGAANEEGQEICYIDTVSGQGVATLLRGCLDTTPKAWPINTPVWIVSHHDVIFDESPNVALAETKYKFLTQTSRSTLDFDAANTIAYTFTERPHLPMRPANCAAGGVKYGTYDSAGQGNVNLTWANRNRMLEGVDILKWEEGTVVPENGQTTKIEVWSSRKTVKLHEVDELAGTSYSLPLFDYQGLGSVWVKFLAERNGLTSLQGHMIEVEGLPVLNHDWDTYGLTPLGVWSLRKRVSTYSGPLVRIRDSSNNAEQDVGFDGNGELDTFTTVGDAMVIRIYDQSGNGNDVVQDDVSYQPILDPTGSPNGKATVDLVGGKFVYAENTGSDSDPIAYLTGNPIFAFAFNNVRTSGTKITMGIPNVTGSNTSPYQRMGLEETSNSFRIRSQYSSTTFTLSVEQQGQGEKFIIDGGNETNRRITIWRNDNDTTAATRTMSGDEIEYPNTTDIRFGANGLGNERHTGRFYEMAVFKEDDALDVGIRNDIFNSMDVAWFM